VFFKNSATIQNIVNTLLFAVQRRNIRITLIAFLILGIVLIAIFLRTSQKLKCPNCNVILVSVDTLGSNHLPCYGYYRNTAPNLCKFANDNVLFFHSYSNASWTLPSHFSMFTALYPKHHGVNEDNDVLGS